LAQLASLWLIATTPDLEEFLRRSQDKLRTVLPGGSLGGKGLGLIVLAAEEQQ
jgi:modulator of FtsH protease HflK